MAYGARSAQKRVSNIKSMGAPTGGLNDIDALAVMGEQFCIQLNNIFPGNPSLITRGGYREFATGMTGLVKTIMTMNKLDGTIATLSVTNAGVYDTSYPVQNPPLAYALSSGSVSYTAYSNIAGQYLVACNGVNNAFLYDGSVFTTFTQVVSPVNPGEISGVDPARLSFVVAHKGRLWFVEKDSMTAYYLDTDAVAGVATPFYLGGVFHRGGSLVAIVTWSLNAGNGLDDKLVFVSSAGELAIYAGSNPNDTDDWALESLFYVAPPVGTANSASDFGGDVLLMTTAGLIPISKVVQGVSNIALYDSAVTKNISKTLSFFANSYGNLDAWQLMSLPKLQALIIIIPKVGNRGARQFIMNTLNGAWGRYDLPATCMAQSGDSVFFGGDGTTYLFNTVGLDGVDFDGEGGVAVESSLFSAFNYFDSPEAIKHWKLIRPLMQSNKPVSCLTKLAIDFDLTPIAGNPYPPDQVGEWYMWDDAIWDQAYWGTFNALTKQWRTVTGVGFCAALLMKIASDTPVSFMACQYVYEKGTAI